LKTWAELVEGPDPSDTMTGLWNHYQATELVTKSEKSEKTQRNRRQE
jgi:hypothetical protein